MYKAYLWLTWRWFSSVFTEKDTCLILKDEYLVSRYEWIHMVVSETQNCLTVICVDLTNYKWYRMYKWVIDSEQIQNAGVALIYRTSSPFWWSLTYPLFLSQYYKYWNSLSTFNFLDTYPFYLWIESWKQLWIPLQLLALRIHFPSFK